MSLEFSIGFLKINLLDIIEILLIGYLLYRVYLLMRGSVALKVLMGFLLLYFFYLIVKSANMSLLTRILDSFMNMGFIALVVVFQQEIRKFLFLIGGATFNRGYFSRRFYWLSGKSLPEMNISPLVEAVKILGGSNTGALIVISKTDDLKFYEDSGDRIDAKVSKRLLLSIFNKNSPLHDGGVIINNDRIIAARCVLPVTEKENVPAKFGLRHKAAIGISEITNAFVLIVSEETGQMAVAQNGTLKSNLSVQEIRTELKNYFNIKTQIV
ncbi:MAG: TIGR00159 family protein [Bacteroidetes bacterium]|nr:TIGR00159 family protein [Bacteroidota bacterium]